MCPDCLVNTQDTWEPALISYMPSAFKAEPAGFCLCLDTTYVDGVLLLCETEPHQTILGQDEIQIKDHLEPLEYSVRSMTLSISSAQVCPQQYILNKGTDARREASMMPQSTTQYLGPPHIKIPRLEMTLEGKNHLGTWASNYVLSRSRDLRYTDEFHTIQIPTRSKTSPAYNLITCTPECVNSDYRRTKVIAQFWIAV